ncbi:MAG: hypothetical protein Q4C95_03210 [Planctomycetia bacterium]|nr:hypothetical protein [Planctomycetia bacterium]
MRKHWTSFLWIILGVAIGIVFGKALLNSLLRNNSNSVSFVQTERLTEAASIPPINISSQNQTIAPHSAFSSTSEFDQTLPLTPLSSSSNSDSLTDNLNLSLDHSTSLVTEAKTQANQTADFEDMKKKLESLQATFLKESNQNLLKNPPNSRNMIENLKNAAKTADEYKTALEIEKQFEQLKTELFQRRHNHIINEMQRIQLKFDELKSVRANLPESILEPLKLLISDSKILTTIPVNLPELAWKRESLVNELNGFLKLVQNRSALFNALNKYDLVCLRTLESQKKQLDLAKRFPGTPYAADFINVANSIDFYKALDDWNDFIIENGNGLNRFAVSDEIALKSVLFYQQHKNNLYYIAEWSILTQRMPQWTIQSKQVPIQERVLKLINHLSKQDYWGYKEKDQWFYLIKAPVVGVNEYQSDLLGNRKSINIAEKNLASIEPMKQINFFRELKNEILLIDNSLRQNDIGQWYAKWGKCLETIRANKEIDPIVQFLVLKDICSTLANGDVFFQKQLVPWLKILESSKFDARIDWFEASNSNVPIQRNIAKELMTFLPVQYFEVNKTTQELDASIKALNHCYQRVGWLDLDLAGCWFCRPKIEFWASNQTATRRYSLFPENDSVEQNNLSTNQEIQPKISSQRKTGKADSEESVIKPASYDLLGTAGDSQNSPFLPFQNREMSGDLFVLLGETSSNKVQWIRVGQMNRNQAEIEIASSELKRGMPVFCRVPIIPFESREFSSNLSGIPSLVSEKSGQHSIEAEATSKRFFSKP